MNRTIATYSAYNERRYGLPWVALMVNGRYDFSRRVGFYTGRPGQEGDLVVTDPVEGQVYAYGRKDHRGGNTEIFYAVWTGEQFLPCDKIGRLTTD